MTIPTIPAGSGFGLANLPYGVYSPAGADGPRRCATRVGDTVVDLATALAPTLPEASDWFARADLNAFMATGYDAWVTVRELLTAAVQGDLPQEALHPVDAVTMHLPCQIADYVDFYASEHHATNVGKIFRPGSAPLTPNWKHLPIGYHGRAGTVVPTGTPVVRPDGQRKAPDQDAPTFGPSRRLDIEAELGFVVGIGSTQGAPVGVDAFADHVFGVVLLNDWSARDLQAWEYVPLGPFLGKSFATSISAWVLPLAALEGSRCPLPPQDPPLLDYLTGKTSGYAIEVEVWINGYLVSTCPYASMYYSPAQMLAHLTSNGASLRTGDLFGSGTISGPAPDQRGSLLELTWNGSQPLQLGTEERTFLADGDEVVLRGRAAGPGGSILRLGEVSGVIAPAPNL